MFEGAAERNPGGVGLGEDEEGLGLSEAMELAGAELLLPCVADVCGGRESCVGKAEEAFPGHFLGQAGNQLLL